MKEGAMLSIARILVVISQRGCLVGFKVYGGVLDYC